MGEGLIDDRTLKLSGEILETAGDHRHLLRAIVPCAAVRDFDELEVVDDQEIQPMFELLTAGFAAEICNRNARSECNLSFLRMRSFLGSVCRE